MKRWTTTSLHAVSGLLVAAASACGATPPPTTIAAAAAPPPSPPAQPTPPPIVASAEPPSAAPGPTTLVDATPPAPANDAPPPPPTEALAPAIRRFESIALPAMGAIVDLDGRDANDVWMIGEGDELVRWNGARAELRTTPGCPSHFEMGNGSGGIARFDAKPNYRRVSVAPREIILGGPRWDTGYRGGYQVFVEARSPSGVAWSCAVVGGSATPIHRTAGGSVIDLLDSSDGFAIDGRTAPLPARGNGDDGLLRARAIDDVWLRTPARMATDSGPGAKGSRSTSTARPSRACAPPRARCSRSRRPARTKPGASASPARSRTSPRAASSRSRSRPPRGSGASARRARPTSGSPATRRPSSAGTAVRSGGSTPAPRAPTPRSRA